MHDEYDQLKAEVRRLGPWHHDVEIRPGIRTGDPALAPPADSTHGAVSLTEPARLFGPLIPELFGPVMANRSFLDCGCNAGGYVFGAAGQGVRRAYGFDARQHWIDQARFLARHLPSEGLTFGCHTLAELPALGLEPFNVTLFSGLFYHLPDPVAGLRIAADLTTELLMVNTSTRPGPDRSLVLNMESETQLMSGVDGLAWMPTGAAVVEAILAWCGFPYTRLIFSHPEPGGQRILIMGARRRETLSSSRAFGTPARRRFRNLAAAALRRLRGGGT